MDRVAARIAHREARSGAHVLDHQPGAAGQHVQRLVPRRGIAVAIRRGAQHRRSPVQAHLLRIGRQATRIRVVHQDRRSRHVQARADVPAALDQQCVHVEARGHTRYHDAQVKRVRVVHQRVHRVLPDRRHQEDRVVRGLLDHQVGTLGQYEDPLVARWDHRIAVGDASDVGASGLQAIRRLEARQGARVGFAGTSATQLGSGRGCQ